MQTSSAPPKTITGQTDTLPRRSRPIPAPVIRPAPIRAALRVGAIREYWWDPPGARREDGRHGWRPRGVSGALHWAADENNLGAVRLLISSGVDPNDPECQIFGGPLYAAERRKQEGLVLLLLGAGTNPIPDYDRAKLGLPPRLSW